MKKCFFALAALICVLPLITACGKSYDYTQHISEARRDIFRAETEEFTVTVTCTSREYPYASDGIACPKSDVVEISLVPVSAKLSDYSVHFSTEDGEWGGETTFRNAFGDMYYSQSVKSFPSGTVNLKVEWDDNVREIAATSVKNTDTLTVEQALDCALEAEKERISRMTVNGQFCGEFYIRLLRRDKNYYYVGIVDTEGGTLSLLLDGESGEVLARRDSKN